MIEVRQFLNVLTSLISTSRNVKHKHRSLYRVIYKSGCYSRDVLFRVGLLKGNSSDCMQTVRQLFSSSGAGAHCWGLLDSLRGGSEHQKIGYVGN